jgi:SAM-dependent methyltransferase
MMQEYFEQNRRNWDDRAVIHRQDKAGGYRVNAFLAGEDNLHPIEDREIGDVSGKRIAHLQCHFGIDTLCLARRGATCAGLDFSPAAIAAARDLQRQTGFDAEFFEANAYDARSVLNGDFDIVYVTWGAINWLPDIAQWAKVVASLLRPGGFLYLLEAHPSLITLDENDPRLRPAYDWRTPRDNPITMDCPTTYTGDTTPIANSITHEWIHPLGDIINGLIAAGLAISYLHEHEEIAWQFAPCMVPINGKRRMWRLPDTLPRLPLSFSLKAMKPK